MSLVAIVHLAERMLNHGQEQEPQAPSAAAKPGKPRVDANWKGQDQFLPSEQTGTVESTAQAAGIFSVKGSALFTAAAEFLLRQSPTGANGDGKDRAFAAAAGARQGAASARTESGAEEHADSLRPNRSTELAGLQE
jgi:hypothetical protein